MLIASLLYRFWGMFQRYRERRREEEAQETKPQEGEEEKS